MDTLVTRASRGRIDREQNERDQRDACNSIGLEAVGAGSDRVAGIVTCTIGDDPRISGVVLLDLEDNLHQIRADIGDLREDAAGNAQCRRP